MERLLPAVACSADYYRIRHSEIGAWTPAITAIVARHNLTEDRAVRFPDGENPVFGLGTSMVLKLVPSIWAAIATREVEMLGLLLPHDHIPAPRLVASGELEDWHYVVSTRIGGEPLHRIWGKLAQDERLAITAKLGRLLADLHALPSKEVNPGGITWREFCRSSFANWTNRRDFPRLSPALQADGPRYLADHGAAVAAAPCALLHGDLAPENLHVRQAGNGWEIAGMIDFGNAMRGDPWFDLTAPSILLHSGDRVIVHALLDAYAQSRGFDIAVIRPSLMVGTLIHPMGDLPECLALVPGASERATWNEVAALFWPD